MSTARRRLRRVVLAFALSAFAPSGWGQAPLAWTPTERAQILSHGPWTHDPRPDRSNRVEGRPSAIRFGKTLFFDADLSADRARSCASCHVPRKAFQDGLPTAAGRTRGIRNTPALLDVARWRWFGWGGSHDSLWAASLAPLLAEGEMGHSIGTLAARARETPAWAPAYAAAFGRPMPADDEALAVDLAKALAAYQATLSSPPTPFDAFRDALARGDDAAAGAYPIAAQRGLRIFIGEGRCSVCHAGPAFSNGEFGDTGVPFFVPGGVDPGRHAGLDALIGDRMNRLGPFNDAGASDPGAVPTRHLAREHRHFGEFRVPGLRQLLHTAPYMHDGSIASLEAVVRHYDRLDEERLHADGERILRPLALAPGAFADLVSFLRTLSSDDAGWVSEAPDPQRPRAPAGRPPRPIP
ncbi:MAG: cytochrome-c peroxidase [Lautropia sp.]